MDAAPLPRFQLPVEPVDDPSDVAETVERAPVTIDRARKIVRRRTFPSVPPSADSTQDVAPEDILLEAYPDPAPHPPRTQRMLPDLVAEAADEVDELLRATDPPPVPSVAPMAVAIGPATPPASFAPPPAPVAAFAPAPPAKRGSGALVALALFAIGVAATAAVVMLVPVDTFARARATAHALVDRSPQPTKPVAPAAAPPPPAVAPPPAPLPAPAPAPPAGPAPKVEDTAPVVPVDALPKSSIAPDTTLVTLPKYAAGHRVYVDNVVLSDGASPVKMKCGKRTIRIGSQGKARELDLPCGRELTLR